jgi:hypothetical protein
MNFPKRIIQKQHESESYAILLYKLRKVGIFRNLTENDYGIDFEIEIVKNGKLTGKYLKVQVKSAEVIKLRKKDNVPTVSGIKQSTLLYWTELSFSTNVLVFLVDIKQEKIYLTKPIFWQAAKLIDGSNKSKTIEFLPVSEYHAEVAKALTSVYAVAPTIRDHIYLHVEAIRHLKQFIDLYLGIFHYDSHMPIEEPVIFKQFLELCQKLLWYRNVVEKFSKADLQNPYSIHHWKKKTKSYELYNYICQIPMKILMPEFLAELTSLRKRILDSEYYWIHKNTEYFRLVYTHGIPQDSEFQKLATAWDEFEKNQLKLERDFIQYFKKWGNGKTNSREN